jgi:ABC-type Fe3+-hydroxamate transport system substrate-binding protein
MRLKECIGVAVFSWAFLLFVLGHTLALSKTPLPQRIVSVVPHITEELYLLGVQDRIVGVTTYCQRPPEAQDKERVGAVVEVNVEKVLSLQPDLIIASPLTDEKQIQKLQDLGMRVEIFEAPQDFEGLCAGLLDLARLVGGEQEAREIINQARRDIEYIKGMVQGLPRPKVFVQIGEKPLVAAGGDSFIDDFVAFAGGVNIAHEVNTSVYSREEVVKRNPDIILIAKMGIAGEREKGQWAKYTTIRAVQANQIYTVDPYRFCSPTPLSFVETVQELVSLFHGTE